MKAVEGELKKLEHKLDEDESEPCKGPGQERQLVVTWSRNIQRLKGKPLNREADPWIEEWIEDSKAICESKGLTREQTALFLLAHLAEKANKRFWILGKTKSKLTLKRCLWYFSECLSIGIANATPNSATIFSYRQKDGEATFVASLAVVCVVQWDSSFKPGRDLQLRNRQAESVREEGLGNELRRLNFEYSDLSHFDVRDRVMKLMWKPNTKQNTLIQESAAVHDIHTANQRKQFEFLVSALSNGNGSVRGMGSRRCWVCDDQ